MITFPQALGKMKFKSQAPVAAVICMCIPASPTTVSDRILRKPFAEAEPLDFFHKEFLEHLAVPGSFGGRGTCPMNFPEETRNKCR